MALELKGEQGVSRADEALRLQVCRAWLAERHGVAGPDAIYGELYKLATGAKSSRTRLKACIELAKLLNPATQQVPLAATAVGVNVNLHIASPDGARAGLQAHGLTLHVGGSNGGVVRRDGSADGDVR